MDRAMAGPRQLMVFRDTRRDRVTMQQPPAAAAGFQTLHPHFSRGQRFEAGEEEIGGRLALSAPWDAPSHHQHQALASAVLRRQRVANTSRALPHLTTSLIHGPGPGQPADWDGGLARHMSVAGGRVDRSLLVVDETLRLRHPVGIERELAGGMSREMMSELRLREARDDIRKSEFVKSAAERVWETASHQNPFEDARDRAEMSRAYYNRAVTAHQLESSSRSRGVAVGWEETAHADLIARYGVRSSSRNLERAHAAIIPPPETGNLSRKRNRDEETEFDRERLHRHRRLSGINSPPDNVLSQAVLHEKESSNAPKPERRHFLADGDEHEDGQLTPPSPPAVHKVQHGSQIQLFKQEQDAMVSSRSEVNRKAEGNAPLYHNVFPFPSFQESSRNYRPKSSSLRPSGARENGTVLRDQREPSDCLEYQSLSKRERFSSEKLKDNDRMISRFERGAESYSILPSDSIDVPRRGSRDLEIPGHPLHSKVAERHQDGVVHRRHQQLQETRQRESRSSKIRRNRAGGELVDSFVSKESSERIGNDVVKRKASKTSPLKDNRQVGEMTISVQKYGQRIVKVEEYKSRDVSNRAANLAGKEQRSLHRGGGDLRDTPETAFSKDRDRLSVIRRKESEGRLPSVGQDAALRSSSSKVGMARTLHVQKPVSQERILPFTQHIKNELNKPSHICDVDAQRPSSIFSRLGGLKPETTSTSLRAMVETSRQEASLPLANDKTQLPTSSNCEDSIVEFQGFPVPTMDNEGFRENMDVGLIGVSGKTSVLERAATRHAGPLERMAKDLRVTQSTDCLEREDFDREQNLELPTSRFPLFTRTAGSLSEKGLEGLEYSFPHKLGQSKLRQENPLYTCESGCPSNLNILDTGTTEVQELSPGSGCKPLPKVISTGHKKDQVTKKSFFNPEQGPLRESSSPNSVGTDIVPVEKGGEEKLEDRSLTWSAEWLAGSRKETATSNSVGNVDYDDMSPQSSIGRSTEAIQQATTSVGTGSTSFCSWLPTSAQSSWMPGEFQQIVSLHAADNTPPAFLREKESVSALEISELNADGEVDMGLSIVPILISNVSTESPTSASLSCKQSTALSVSSMPLCTVSTPKEVRLFGANLNAPMFERIESLPKVVVGKDDNLVATGASPAIEDTCILGSLDETCHSTGAHQLEKDVCLPVVLTGDAHVVHCKETVRLQETSLIHHDAVRNPTSDVPMVQIKSEEPHPVSQEQNVPPMNIQKGIASAQVRQPSLPHSAGAHTWRRGASSTQPANSAIMFKSARGFGVANQPATGARGAAYVRKGNSLVRAPGAVSSLPANDPKTMTSFTAGHVRPMVRQPPVMKAIPFRNTFKPNPSIAKNFYPSHRKYIAPPVENEGAIVHVRPPIPLPGPLSNGESVRPLLSQVALKVTTPGNAGSVLLTSVEQQSVSHSGVEQTPVTNSGSDNNLVEVGAGGPANDTSPTIPSNSVMSTAGNSCVTLTHKPASANRLYVRRKANQLVVAPSQSVDSVPTDSSAGKSGLMPDLYFKRKVNQLVRSNVSKENAIGSFALGVHGSHPPSEISEDRGGTVIVPKKTRLGKVLRQKKSPTGRSSWVWTLSGAALGPGSAFTTQSLRTGQLFPWKRQLNLRTPSRRQRRRSLPEGKKGSLLFLMSKRLRKVRPVQPVYTRSADGFSLHRSGVMSLGGGNLKWTKSLEKRAKQASEAATKAVAEEERRKREKKESVVEVDRRASGNAICGEGERIVWVGLVRYKMDAASKTLQRIPDAVGTVGDTDATSPTGLAKPPPLLTPRRSIIGGAVYLRVGNGNQLVRDPKAASRALASEKVRWSLHNARSRGAKKQQYCQFFTKFGKCNKEDGKCSYIHDPDKVAVCTKFLNGNCIDSQCLLTHKVIPERMPDCSFFLEGLCTNENCPYRHVNVNPKAPYCDGFLRGYCKDGDKCNKKHTYVCSVYAETGECLDRSICKFHHPKKKQKPSAAVNGRKIGTKRKRRYFSLESDSTRQKITAANYCKDVVVTGADDTPNEGSMEFISLSNMESDEDQKVFLQSQPWSRSGLAFRMKEAEFVENVEQWIKPTFLRHMPVPAAAAH